MNICENLLGDSILVHWYSGKLNYKINSLHERPLCIIYDQEKEEIFQLWFKDSLQYLQINTNTTHLAFESARALDSKPWSIPWAVELT